VNLNGESRSLTWLVNADSQSGILHEPFRHSTGVPPRCWLLKRRVHRAIELLTNRVLSLTDTTFSCGFTDRSHFTRVFTALVRVSPGAWRRDGGSQGTEG
jgi:AraC family transcriptional regulator